MSESAPLLQQIHDGFDVYERYPYTDHSTITKIGITSADDTYRITTYPGGIGYGYDGLAIDVKARGGIFGEDEQPARVETSRDYGGLLIFDTQDVPEQNDDGLVIVGGTLSTPAKREGLLLPGDDGFELFTDLHRKLKALKAPLTEALQSSGIFLEPQLLQYHESTGNRSWNHDTELFVHHRSSKIEVTSDKDSFEFSLDGTEMNNLSENPASDMRYRAGVLEYQDGYRKDLATESLAAFSGLHKAMATLYR